MDRYNVIAKAMGIIFISEFEMLPCFNVEKSALLICYSGLKTGC